MPITPVGGSLVILPALLSTGHLGVATPAFSRGLASGLSSWALTVQVSTIDSGSAGVGKGTGVLLIPQPVLLATLTSGFTSNGLLGVFAPLTILGLANGISLALAQGVISTTHVGVGAGTGLAKFSAPPAVTSLLQGFASAGLTGNSIVRIANAISSALLQATAPLVLPVVITGPSAPTAAAGVGSGKIL